MTKLFIWLLDTAILFAAIWFFVLDDLPDEFWYLAGLGLAALLVWAVVAALKPRTFKKPHAKKEAEALMVLQEAIVQEQVHKEKLAAEREARRPLCAYCGKKTGSIFQHRRIDGSPDRRYRDNPLLCNRCFKPYSPVRPGS